MSTTDAFARAVADRPVALERAVLCIGARGEPGADLAAAVHALDDLATRVPEASVAALVETIFGADGFCGDRDDYYNPHNSFLHSVLDRRRGIPISLSVVAMCVADRLGVDLYGVGTPAHFLVGSGEGDERVFIDVFNGGQMHDRDGLDGLFAEVAPGVAIEPYLAPLAPVDIVRRVLNNLVHIYRRRADRAGLVWSTQFRALLPGAPVADGRAHAGALAASGQFAVAADLLDSLSTTPQATGDRAEELRAEAARLRSRLN